MKSGIVFYYAQEALEEGSPLISWVPILIVVQCTNRTPMNNCCRPLRQEGLLLQLLTGGYFAELIIKGNIGDTFMHQYFYITDLEFRQHVKVS